MTEKEKTLELIMKHFMAKAEKMSHSKDPIEMISASQAHWAAIEVAGLGAATETIDWAVREYLKKATDRLFGSDDFQRAISMTMRGASEGVAEEVMRVAVRNYSWIWPVEKLTDYIGRKPTEIEILSLVQVERADTARMSENHHEKLIQFARQYSSLSIVQRIIDALDDKTKEFNSHSD